MPASLAKEWNVVVGSASNRFGVSNSMTRPLSSTMTLSESNMVFSRWAIVKIVQFLNSDFMVF